MVVASLTPPGVDTLLAALLRGERVTLPLIDQVALFFGLIVANLTRDFVAHLFLNLLGHNNALLTGDIHTRLLRHRTATLLRHLLTNLLGDILVHRLADLFGNVGALLPGDMVALLVGLIYALLPRHGNLLRPAVLPHHRLALLLVDLARYRFVRLDRHAPALLPRDAPAPLLRDRLLHLQLDGEAFPPGDVLADIAGKLPGHRLAAVLRDELALLPRDLVLDLPGDLLALGLSNLVAAVSRYLLANVLLDGLAQGRLWLAVFFVQGVVGVVDVEVGSATNGAAAHCATAHPAAADLVLDLFANCVIFGDAVLLELLCAFLLVDGGQLGVVDSLANLLVGRRALLLELGLVDRLALLLVDDLAFLLGHLHDGNVYGGVAHLLNSSLALLLELGLYDVVDDVVRHGSAFLLGNLNAMRLLDGVDDRGALPPVDSLANGLVNSVTLLTVDCVTDLFRFDADLRPASVLVVDFAFLSVFRDTLLLLFC